MALLQVAKQSLKVTMNHLNEGLFIRSEDGTIGYCNELGIKLVDRVCREVFPKIQTLNRYYQHLRSMNFLSQNLFATPKNNLDYQKEKTIMNAPLLRLYMNGGSGERISDKNMALTATEQINLQISSQIAEGNLQDQGL
jgi:hypothetical protein